MPTYSKNGKRLGRPPKDQSTARTLVPAGFNPHIRPTDDNTALTVGRAMLKFAARYDAAGRGKRMAGWNAPSSGPNTALAGLQTIRDRSRDSVRNNWSGESLVQKWATTLIGIGITPRFRRITDKTRRQQVVDLWSDFVQQADADGVLNLYGQQTLVVRAWLESGEVFARRRWRFTDEGFKIPMQVQLLESDMCPLFDADTYQGLPSGNIIRDGIEFNKRGRRIAYWFYKEHPGDSIRGAMPSADMLVRVLATDVAHIFEPHRPGQRRGVSIFAPILMRQRNTDDYEDTTLERQKLANLWVGFITRSLPAFDPNDVDSDPMSGLERVVDGDGNGLVPLRPGLIQELEEGQDFKFANPPEAGTTYSDYLRTNYLGSSSGGGMPYELFSGDIKGISDRTLRVTMNEFRRFASQRQWQIIIPQFCQRVVDWFVDGAVFGNLIQTDEADMVRRVEHSPHGWAAIHPTQDVQGKILAIEAGLRSRSSAIGEDGDDPDTVDEERKADDKREQTLKIGPYGAGAANKQPGQSPAQQSQTP